MADQTFPNSADAKKAGHFSRRHRTSAEHTQARLDPSLRNPASREVRRRAAELRQQERAKLTDAQQLEALDKLLGVGRGAERERARLKKRMAAEPAAKPPKKAKK